MFATLDLPLISGMCGVAVYVVAYGLLQGGVISGASYIYASLNILAASLVLLSLTTDFNLASALIQITFIAISVGGIIRLRMIHRPARFTDEEQLLVDEVLPSLPSQLAKRILRNGDWINADTGYRLTEETEPVTHLHFMMDGEATVLRYGRRIAKIHGGLIGEVNVMHGGPASATVELTAPSRLFVITGDRLRRLSATSTEIGAAIAYQLAHATREKLVRANRSLAELEADREL